MRNSEFGDGVRYICDACGSSHICGVLGCRSNSVRVGWRMEAGSGTCAPGAGAHKDQEDNPTATATATATAPAPGPAPAPAPLLAPTPPLSYARYCSFSKGS